MLYACLMQLPSCTLKHMDSSGAINDISTDELTAGKKVRWGVYMPTLLEPNTPCKRTFTHSRSQTKNQ
jgi:hypothetical protein